MSNTPFFDALLGENEEKKRREILTTLSTPFLTSAKPVLPKRNVAQPVQPPEVDPEFAKKVQEFISTAPMQILEKTATTYSKPEVHDNLLEYAVGTGPLQNHPDSPMGEFIKSLAPANGFYPQMAWVDEFQSGEEDEVYIESKPITFDRVQMELKDDTVTESIRRRQMDVYLHGVMAGRQKAAEEHHNLPVPPMTEKTMPSWIADEIRESNEMLSDPEPMDHTFIQRGNKVDGTITIFSTGFTSEQTDESVNAASNDSNHTTVKPLWVTNEE